MYILNNRSQMTACSGLSQFIMIAVVLFALVTFCYIYVYKKDERYSAPMAAYIDLFDQHIPQQSIEGFYLASNDTNRQFAMVQSTPHTINTSLFQNPAAHTFGNIGGDPAKMYEGDE
jgi:hypothetical protein